ncbi:hypothetical protein M413DRAFT_77380, partial [Hebeloma cylindrosporum]
NLVVPTPLGLPVYSASGFDLLSILARVATRPYPRVRLGPVDLTCSFVVVDIRRYDHPIVYCSPTFCQLTGYSEHEVLGRNCRFLQAPGGQVEKGEPRTHTSPDAVAHLRKSLMADKECQTSILNYKKNGDAFINLVTVIPVPGGGVGEEGGDVVYHVGFQVNLNEQPHAILDKLRDGSYLVNYATQGDVGVQDSTGKQQQQQISTTTTTTTNARDRKANAIPPVVISKELKRMLADPKFQRSLPMSHGGSEESNHLVHLVLLEAMPDFVHVVSLKGTFLYVAPSVRRVLGYEAEEMVGMSIADYAHAEDVVPLMRELKESSATGVTAAMAGEQGLPRSVDLLYRAKTKMGRYVWVECRGRLHVEPGKGRKAIILSGRAREMTSLTWEDVRRAGGLAKEKEKEVWGMLGGTGAGTATFHSVGKSMENVLGWTEADMLGKALSSVIIDEAALNLVGAVIAGMRNYQRLGCGEAGRVRTVRCALRRKDGGVADVWFVIYRADLEADERGTALSITPTSLLYQIRLADAETVTCGDLPVVDMFEELAISRGSSWQYEMQQLRFTNQRLKDEYAALSAIEATNYPQLYSQQPYPVYESQQPSSYLHQPQPQAQYLLNNISHPPVRQRPIHPRPQEWSTMAPHPDHPHPPQGYPRPLKRPWPSTV